MKKLKYLMTFESYSILGRVETVTITNEQGETVTCDAKIDTGSYSSRISGDIAKKLKLPVVDQRKVTSAMGEENRTFVELQFNINGIEIKTSAGIADMEGLRNEVAIGRKDIEMVDGIVDVKKNNKKPIGIPVNTPVEVEIEIEPDVEPTIEPEVEIQLPVDESLNEKGKEEKYFIWTDKTGRGEEPITLTKTLIEDTWDLEQEDWDGVTLGEFIEDCYIDDEWETREEKLVCDKIY